MYAVAKFQMRGMSEYLKELDNVAWATSAICKAVVYKGAAVVADEIKRGIKGLQVVSDKHALAAYQRLDPTLISYTQKKGLLESFGVARIQESYGYVSTKLGFDGYNDVVTDEWPRGQPNALIARACESGSVAMLKQPFMRSAQNKAKAPALDAMQKTADAELKKITGGT